MKMNKNILLEASQPFWDSLVHIDIYIGPKIWVLIGDATKIWV